MTEQEARIQELESQLASWDTTIQNLQNSIDELNHLVTNLTEMIQQMRGLLLQRDVLHADETPVQVLKEPGKKPQTKSYMWLYRTGNDGEPPIILYDYRPSRSGNNAEEYIKGFHSYLHSDGYSGYNKLNGVTICGCWAHLRRKFDEALPIGKASQTSGSYAQC